MAKEKFRITERGVNVDGKPVPIGEEITVEVAEKGDIPGWLVNKAELVPTPARGRPPKAKDDAEDEAEGSGE